MANTDEKTENVMLQLLGLLLRPVMGWRAIKRGSASPEAFAAGCLYPMMGLAALSEFANIYYLQITVTEAIQAALTVFLALFATLFLAGPTLRLASRHSFDELVDKPFFKKFVMAALASLALFQTLFNCIYVLREILVFLPIYTIYIIARGVRLLGMPREEELKQTAWLSLVIVGWPVLIGLAFMELLSLLAG